MKPAFRPRGTMETRREDLSRIGAMTVKPTEVAGRALIIDPGEVTIFVPFPVNFTERPVFTTGGEMEDNHRVVAGNYPLVTGTVVRWEKVKEIQGATDGYYTGAYVAVYITGEEGQQLWFHFSFKGKAIRNPINNLEDVEAEL